jgi:multicomponent Na+:H+ antiporter subunit D
LAWSSVAQIGYIVLGISLLSLVGLAAGILHLLNHAVIKTCLFLAIGAVALRTSGVTLDHMAGLGRRMPYTMAAIVVAGLGLIGVPLTAGFVSKWALLNALMQAEHWWLTGVMLLSSLLAVAYVWRMIEIIYFKPANANTTDVREAPLTMVLMTWLLAGLSVLFGLQGSQLLGYCLQAASRLMGGQ